MSVETLIDLTHPMENGMPVWPGHPVFEQCSVASFEAGDIACNHSLSLSEHSGTHLDAPAHFVPGGQSIDEVPLWRFFGSLAVIPATDSTPDSVLPASRLEAFEAAHGVLPAGGAVMVHFGWDRYWAHPEEGAKFLRDWPGLSAEAAQLLKARNVSIVGCDCMSIDHFSSTEFPAHRILLGAGILIGENFARLGELPPLCRLSALPLPIKGGSGAPLRAVAHLDGACEGAS
ncbi:kynurenine formamidase [Breoghania corrubedonensis]|uniref:Kynurenine formamidase n=1 Tax=Breoghania corrubedonensis TaxID=665038 RepID=A0A2T5V5E6_9HYPH|nr:cyclase family protein [Breoghania corrubedonensis]PTW58979.1 kynurenine formamidase [Breoghania corrubedonensis]